MDAISYRATLTAKFKHSLPISLIYDTPGQKHVRHHILDKYGADGRVKMKALLAVPLGVPKQTCNGYQVVQFHVLQWSNHMRLQIAIARMKQGGLNRV